MSSPSLEEQKLLEQIRAALNGLKYGSIELTVHDGRVVQLDRRERIRLESRQP